MEFCMFVENSVITSLFHVKSLSQNCCLQNSWNILGEQNLLTELLGYWNKECQSRGNCGGRKFSSECRMTESTGHRWRVRGLSSVGEAHVPAPLHALQPSFLHQ